MTIITPTGIAGITSITSTGNTLQFQNASGNTVNVSGVNVTSGTDINVSGIVTASGFVGNVTGNVNSSGVSTFSGGVIVAAGSTSTPSISPTGDNNTGIFFPSADTIAFTEGGVEALRLDSSGRFGIGTINPGNSYGANGTEKLQVVGGNVRLNPGLKTNTNVPLILSTMESSNNMELIFIQEKTSYHSIESVHQGVAYTPLSFQPNGGSIGIGITNPGAKLHVSNGNIKVDSGYGIDFSATANSSGTMISELLSDYEEGSWTPTLSNGGTVSGINQATYTRIGRLVTIYFYINLSSIPNNGTQFQIGGLPYTAIGSSHYSTGQIGYCGTFNLGPWRPLVITGGNYIYFHRTDGTNVTLLNSGATGMGELLISLWYYTA